MYLHWHRWFPQGNFYNAQFSFLVFAVFYTTRVPKTCQRKQQTCKKHIRKHIKAWRTSSHRSTPPQVVKVLAKNKYCYRPSTTAFFFFLNRKLCKQIFYHHPIRNPFSFDTLCVFKLTMWFFFPLTLVVAANSFCLTRPQVEVALSLVLCKVVFGMFSPSSFLSLPPGKPHSTTVSKEVRFRLEWCNAEN